MPEDPFAHIYQIDFFSNEELEQALSKAHRENPLVYFEKFLEETFMEVELEEALANYANSARESPLLAEDALIAFQYFLNHPPQNPIDFLFTHAGLRPYHNDGLPDERPYSEAETMEFMQRLYLRLVEIFEGSNPG